MSALCQKQALASHARLRARVLANLDSFLVWIFILYALRPETALQERDRRTAYCSAPTVYAA